MVLSGLRGAVGFLTRIPVGRSEHSWDAFRQRPLYFPLVGYFVGVLVALPFLLLVPPATVAVLYVLLVFALTGINHADGLADLGDAAVVHGSPDDRREVMHDTTVGVGGVVAVAVAVLALGLGGTAVAGLPPLRAVGLVVAAEVAAKLAMATLACAGTPAHEGMGAQLTGASGLDFVAVAAVAAPAALLTWPTPVAPVAVGAGIAVSLAARSWATRRLGGVSGDVFGATNELARVVALHAGVVTWTLW